MNKQLIFFLRAGGVEWGGQVGIKDLILQLDCIESQMMQVGSMV